VKKAALICMMIVFGAAHLSALDSITCEVCPGENPPGGMGKISAGMANLVVTVGSNCADRYIQTTPNLDVSDSTAMWSLPPVGSNPCDPGKFQTWTWKVTVTHPNQSVHVTFNGVMPLCHPTGPGGGEPPTFTGAIVHMDFDVDSDRTSRVCQHPPDRSDQEDAVEEADPSLILACNTGYDEGGQWLQQDDAHKAGIVTSDIDLMQAILDIVESNGTVTFTYPASINLYTGNGTHVPSGQGRPVTVGIHQYLIEGVTIGKGKIDVLFVPDSGHGDAKDCVTYEVKEERRLAIGVSGFGGTPSGAWEYVSEAVASGGATADGSIFGAGVFGLGPLPRVDRERQSGHMIWARRATRRAIQEWMKDDYTQGGTENRNIISIGVSWGAKNSTAYVEFFREEYCKHPRAHTIIEGVDGPIPNPYPRIGPAVNKLNYYSAELHFPRGTSIPNANLEEAFDLTLTTDAAGNITNVQAVPPTPSYYLKNRYRKIGAYWFEIDYDWNVHIVTEWVGARRSFEALKPILSSNP